MTAISADHLRVTRGAATLIHDLSLAFSERGSVALIGPNGAGKSTLLKVLAGLDLPQAGRVRIGTGDLAALPRTVRARMIGFLPQHFEPHWDLAVGDLVRLGAARNPELGAEAVSKTITRFELGGLERRRWSTLSGGECARVLLAMVLVANPPVLLADEPAAALDIRHRLDVVEALAKRGRDRLSVVAVHDLDLAFRFFERVVVLVDGRIVADAPAAELIADARLDAAFGVRFERIRTAEGWSLLASKREA